MKNYWNRFVYRSWAPFYDALVGISFFKIWRHKVIKLLHLQAGQRLLIVGVGTGADLPMLPVQVQITGIDLSTAMLRQARRKANRLAVEIELIEADAASPPFADDTFDAVLMFLILSVVEVPQDCLKEVFRTARTGATVVVFDKFLDAEQPSWRRRLFNILTRFLGTDINRNFTEILNDTELKIESQEGCGFGKSYLLILLRNG